MGSEVAPPIPEGPQLTRCLSVGTERVCSWGYTGRGECLPDELLLSAGGLAGLESSLTRDELMVAYVGAQLHALLLQPVALLPRLLLHKLRLLLQSHPLQPVHRLLLRTVDFGREPAKVRAATTTRRMQDHAGPPLRVLVR